MSILKKTGRAIGMSGRVLNGVVTLGGSEVLREAKALYDLEQGKYEVLFADVTALKSKMDQTLEQIGSDITSAQTALTECQKLLSSKHLSLEQQALNNAAVTKLAAFNASFNSALNVGFGGVVGGSLAVGAWGVVSLVGSASTGAAISGLSGVAAYNATLAWFGGGALAAGGAGMSGGMMVLGGIVAAPMIFFATKGAYAKAEKANTASEKLKVEISKLKKVKAAAQVELTSLRGYAKTIKTLCLDYTRQVAVLTQALYPHGAVSRFQHRFLKLFGRAYFTDEKLLILVKLRVLTETFLEAFEGHKARS